MEGVYVPSLYPMETLPDGAVRPPVDGPKIRKRTARTLDGASFPVDYIVPFTEQVHDRISLEVLRGCTQGCRFCQAGMTTRPVRERTVTEVESLMRRTLEKTGYEEVSLVSLSTCDHSHVRTLVERAAEVAREEQVTISLPSLRLDSFSVELADMAATTRRTGLTFAPEAASPRLRAVINKWIPDDELIEMATGAFDKGWEHVKTYFMIGLPTERDEDIEAIVDLCQRTVRAGKAKNQKAMVYTGVSTFVPKPFTPFQWAAQIDLAETERKQGILLDRFRKMKAIKFGRHHPEETFLEGLVSRSDRRAADLIEAAWRQGARFDAWSEHLDFGAWQRAIEQTAFDVQDALRERALDERLPWDHIDIHIPKAWFAADWQRATELKHAPDCRQKRCHDCGVIDVERELCASMLRGAIEGRKAEKRWVRKAREQRPPADAVQRLRVRVGRAGDARFLGHLEWRLAWFRALRRAKAPIAYSQGFHPLPRIDFSSALPSGEESMAEYLDVRLTSRLEPEQLAERLRAVAPREFVVMGASEVALHGPALQGEVDGWDYEIVPAAEQVAAVAARVAEVNAAESLMVVRRTKSGPRDIDVRPLIAELRAENGAVRLGLRTVDGRAGKAREIVELLGIDGRARVRRTEVYVRGERLA
jgi:radical SAM-linked protein